MRPSAMFTSMEMFVRLDSHGKLTALVRVEGDTAERWTPDAPEWVASEPEEGLREVAPEMVARLWPEALA